MFFRIYNASFCNVTFRSRKLCTKTKPTFILHRQLLDPPHQRPKRLLILSRATASLHNSPLMLRLMHEQPIQTLNLPELVLRRVHRAVPEHLLHPEHIHPRVRQREPNLNLAAVLLAQLTEVVASHRRLDPYLAHPPHQTHVTPHLQR